MRRNLQVLIPAAGYGVRVGSPESKEMLGRRNKHGSTDTCKDDSPMIKDPIEKAWAIGAAAHVITRKEKLNLIKYLEDLKAENPNKELSVQIVEPTKDWPDTLLLSKPFWKEWNLVVLPDTQYAPTDVMNKMCEGAEENLDVIVAEHKVKNLSEWGVISPMDSFWLRVCEKPKGEMHESAWGLYMFKKEIGEELLKAQSLSTQTHEIIRLPLKAKSLSLDFFEDLTR